MGGAELSDIVSYSYQGKEIIEIKQSVSSMYNGHIYNCDGTQITFDQATFIDFSKKSNTHSHN